MTKTDQLSVVHAAYVLGADTPRKVEKATGVPYNSAASCLSCIRKADGDLESARQLRNDSSAQRQRLRYHTDPIYRALTKEKNNAWDRRKRNAARKKREDEM